MGKKTNIRRISKAEWLDAALNALEEGGIDAVRIERLAKKLGTSRRGQRSDRARMSFSECPLLALSRHLMQCGIMSAFWGKADIARGHHGIVRVKLNTLPARRLRILPPLISLYFSGLNQGVP